MTLLQPDETCLKVQFMEGCGFRDIQAQVYTPFYIHILFDGL